MRILLTGGTGLIGRALCQYWQRQGHELWVWSREPNKVAQLAAAHTAVQVCQELAGNAGQCSDKSCWSADCRTALGRLLASKFSGAAALI